MKCSYPQLTDEGIEIKRIERGNTFLDVNMPTLLKELTLTHALTRTALRLILRKSTAVAIALGVFFSLIFAAPYNHYFKVPSSHTAAYQLFIIQADDFGSLWSVADAQEVLERVSSDLAFDNVYVLLFIHGWHHNADPEDESLQLFRSTLARISRRLASSDLSEVRRDLSGTGSFRLIGVYVGWRGRSLPGVLDYLTMWWRKSAAERVGDGDVREFILRLQRIYRRNSAGIRPQSAGRRHFMGLVTVGHSFGAQVLLKSMAAELEADLAERAPVLSGTVSPPVPLSGLNVRAERLPIEGFGDVNILLNPATEAYEYARIDRLSRQLSYPSCQLPQLLVFSAVNDVPRKFFFPLARGITRLFRPGFRTSEQGVLWGTALGELKEQQTHTLRVAEVRQENSLQDADYNSESGRARIRDWDFTGTTVFNDVELERIERRATSANSPVAVVSADSTLVDGHNGIFEARFWNFLVDYVTFMEGKRMLWHQHWLSDGTYEDRGCEEATGQ